MIFKQNPSKDIVFGRIPNFYIEDNAGLFDNGLGLIAYPFSSEVFLVDQQPIKLLVYSRNDVLISYPNLSSNEIAIIISVVNNEDLKIKIKLSNYLLQRSRFKGKAEEMNAVSINKKKNELMGIGKTISTSYLLSFFDSYNELLFPIDYAKDVLKLKTKEIRIEKIIDDKKPFKPSTFTKMEDGKLNITIGLFFDGTNNSRYNTEYGYKQIIKELKQRKKLGENVLFEDVLKQFQEGKVESHLGNYIKPNLITEDSSYLNDYTNIVYLYELYQKQDSNYKEEIILKQYIQGIGPATELDEFGRIVLEYKTDSDYLGKATGTMSTGVDSRMKEGVLKVIKQLKSISEESKMEIGRVTFDVFGFSRGATVARKFHNELLKETNILYNVDGLNNNYKCKGGCFAEYFWEYLAKNDIKLMNEKYSLDMQTKNALKVKQHFSCHFFGSKILL